ncbi:acyltransferase [Candidatus Ruminimicrobium bovinum]|uniref:acyltransferase n=1 Tax=Candidatus Ruminimicrobium bovinum TaxID=3242779 RepID=UPI0039B982DC
MKKQRIFYFDFLRIFAALAVVMASQYNLTGIYHYSACFLDGIVRWGVPIFVMISGTLFLEPKKTITINNILKKYIFRIAILFVVWSLFYSCINCVTRDNLSFSFILKHIVIGHFHQWFLYMIAGLYLITPLLRPITEKKDKNLLLYLLIIWFVMASIVPFIKFIIPQTEKLFDVMINKIHFSFPLSYLGYFILGYYLHNYINIKNKILMIIILFVCLLVTVLGDIKYSIPGKQSFFLNNFCPFVIITAISIFLFIKNKCLSIEQSNKFILKLSDLTLGVYLIHPFFIRISKKLNLFIIINSTLNDYNFFTIPIIFILVGSCSFLFVYLLSKIPIIKKYCL